MHQLDPSQLAWVFISFCALLIVSSWSKRHEAFAEIRVLARSLKWTR
jgi:hypothetical protein